MKEVYFENLSLTMEIVSWAKDYCVVAFYDNDDDTAMYYMLHNCGLISEVEPQEKLVLDWKQVMKGHECKNELL